MRYFTMLHQVQKFLDIIRIDPDHPKMYAIMRYPKAYLLKFAKTGSLHCSKLFTHSLVAAKG